MDERYLLTLIFALFTLCMISGCAAKAPHKKQMFRFVGVHADGSCEVDSRLTKWDAKTGAVIVFCK